MNREEYLEHLKQWYLSYKYKDDDFSQGAKCVLRFLINELELAILKGEDVSYE